MFNQYQMEKYEKVEFDMNSIDSAFMKNKLFKGMEFIFNQMDTSKVTGKTICQFLSTKPFMMFMETIKK
jgi:hypothetical protein